MDITENRFMTPRFVTICVSLLLMAYTPAAAQQKPYSSDTVISLLQQHVATDEIVSGAKRHCVDMSLVAGESRLRAAGADDALLRGLVSACWIGVTGEA